MVFTIEASDWLLHHPSVSLLQTDWVVTPQFKVMTDHRFSQLDTDADGLINGGEVKDIFLQSGLPQQTLASIW